MSEGNAVSDLDRLEAAAGECREMIREAHAATKDLRAAVREAKSELHALTREEVAAHIQLEVSRQLEELDERTREAISVATQKVIAEFDRFGESLLGKEAYWQKASGRRAATRPDTEVVTLKVSEGAAYGAALQALWCWRLSRGEKVGISEITDQFVELNKGETAEPDTRSTSVYRELQALQDKMSMALRESFAKHRQFVLR